MVIQFTSVVFVLVFFFANSGPVLYTDDVQEAVVDQADGSTCYEYRDVYGCDEGVQNPFCSDKGCHYQVISWETVLMPGSTTKYVERPVLEWSCDDSAYSNYSRFEVHRSCEPATVGTKYERQALKEVRPVCYYVIECAGCSVSPGFFSLPNRRKEGENYDQSDKPGESRYANHSCNAFSSSDDLPVSATINECFNSKGACPVAPPPAGSNVPAIANPPATPIP